MSIKYKIRSNEMMGQPGRHAGMVQPRDTKNLDDVIARMAQNGAAVSTALAMLEHFFTAVESILLEGDSVNTPLVNLHLSIRGTFEGPDDGSNPRRHRIVARATPGKRLRRVIRNRARPAKAAGGRPGPVVDEYADLNSGSCDRLVTPGGVGQLLGHHLKLDLTDPRQGLFFVGAGRRAIPVSVVAKNNPRELLFVIPDLAPGEYRLQVRNTQDDCEQLRSGELSPRLTVTPDGAEPADGAASCVSAADPVDIPVGAGIAPAL